MIEKKEMAKGGKTEMGEVKKRGMKIFFIKKKKKKRKKKSWVTFGNMLCVKNFGCMLASLFGYCWHNCPLIVSIRGKGCGEVDGLWFRNCKVLYRPYQGSRCEQVWSSLRGKTTCISYESYGGYIYFSKSHDLPTIVGKHVTTTWLIARYITVVPVHYSNLLIN